MLTSRTQTKEYLPAHALRRILALQTELVKGAQQGPIDRSSITNPSLLSGTPTSRHPPSQRTLLSANFGIGPQNGHRATNSLGRNLISAGDRLRDLIVPDALASVVTAPVGWIPGIGAGSKRSGSERDTEKVEKMRKELEDLLAANCPLCESVVAGLDKPFVQPGEVDASWAL